MHKAQRAPAISSILQQSLRTFFTVEKEETSPHVLVNQVFYFAHKHANVLKTSKTLYIF